MASINFLALITFLALPSCSYDSYKLVKFFSVGESYTSDKPGASSGENNDQSPSCSTRCINKSGVHIAKNKSLALISSLPVFFLKSINSNTSACHGSRYIAKEPLRLPP